MRYCLITLTGFFLSAVAQETIAADPLAWLPKEVNAVARLNVADVYQSPLAKKEGWIKKATESFIQQESFIPPGTTQIVIGAELDLSDSLSATRKYSILVPEKDLTFEKLSVWLPGGIETVSGKKMTQFGRDGYIVDAGDGCWLTAASSNRQFISRWLKNGPMPGGTQLSSFLRNALKPTDKPPQLLLAIDFQDCFSSSELLTELKSMDWYKSEASAKSVADVIESLHGVTITLAVDTERKGTVTFEFGRDAAPLKPDLEKLINEVLSRVGIPSEVTQDWKWNVAGSKVIGSGPLSPGSGREILSIMDPPSITHAISASSASAEKPVSPEDVMAKTSLKYCNSLKVLLDDLRATLNKEKHNHAVLQERYSRKIDDLPKLNVDGALLDFGANVSSSLRYQGQAERMNLIKAGTQKRQTYAAASMPGYSYVGPYNSYNYGYALGPGDSPGVIDAQANQASKQVRFSEWKQIEDGLAAVRRAMTEKYKLEF